MNDFIHVFGNLTGGVCLPETHYLYPKLNCTDSDQPAHLRNLTRFYLQYFAIKILPGREILE